MFLQSGQEHPLAVGAYVKAKIVRKPGLAQDANKKSPTGRQSFSIAAKINLRGYHAEFYRVLHFFVQADCGGILTGNRRLLVE